MCWERLVKKDASTDSESTWQIISDTLKESPSGDVVFNALLRSSKNVSSRMKGDDSSETGS